MKLAKHGRAAIACKQAAARDGARSAERRLVEKLRRPWSAKQLSPKQEAKLQALRQAERKRCGECLRMQPLELFSPVQWQQRGHKKSDTCQSPQLYGLQKLRRAGRATQISPEQEHEHQALQRADSGASQLAVAAHAGEASLQRVPKTQDLLQQVRKAMQFSPEQEAELQALQRAHSDQVAVDLLQEVQNLGRYPKESRSDVVEQQLARMPRRLAPPLCDPVWRDGHLLYVEDAFDSRGLSERVLRVTSCPSVKAQHAYKCLGDGVGSFNFGVVPHMGIPGMYLQTQNRNVLSSRVEREELRRFLWRRLRPQLEAVVPGWRIWKKHYLRQCRDIPPLTVDGEALPWNGEQLNAFHAAVRHRDRHGARGLPCLIAFGGWRGGVVRVHGQNTFVDVATKPGGLLLFDSTLDHEVLAPPQAARAVDDKGCTRLVASASCGWRTFRRTITTHQSGLGTTTIASVGSKRRGAWCRRGRGGRCTWCDRETGLHRW